MENLIFCAVILAFPPLQLCLLKILFYGVLWDHLLERITVYVLPYETSLEAGFLKQEWFFNYSLQIT